MKFHVMTLFPEMIEQGLHTSILGRAMDAGIISLSTVNIRDYSEDKHRHVDDYPYGGGAGMVMAAEPIAKCYEDICAGGPKKRLIYLTPWGRVFNQDMAKELAKEEELVFLCGHYEGVDERVLSRYVTDPVSIGDYVLSGGELPAMVMIDAIARMVPGVLTNEESGETESFENNLLEYPQYTRPEVWRGEAVPEVLLSGHHANVDRWRTERSIDRTLMYRPELLAGAVLDKKAKKYYNEALAAQKRADDEVSKNEK
ncbi:MAG: tRNA (guanosine(37)-N1)-methyltransferase TrmD [Lachnospiraceae bacterium]|nr:tRNA (guanosine(37)-N1)-methyltransferase TrmD [Lachnospiraceae bacterium]MBQ3979950.1 tRNA (guanosine(37)-N1)-methyltransferase TrmD [Lachnospiraceae bacterium]MCR5375498.1 tRNA (guanosine(37)-N1)-methyltransferase TrmD [Lachnospiraceae bacterium]